MIHVASLLQSPPPPPPLYSTWRTRQITALGSSCMVHGGVAATSSLCQSTHGRKNQDGGGRSGRMWSGRMYMSPSPWGSGAGNARSGSFVPPRESGSHRINTERSNKPLSLKHLCPNTRAANSTSASSLIGLVMP